MLDITNEELDAMETVDVRTVDINTLTDIRDGDFKRKASEYKEAQKKQDREAERSA